MTPKKIQEKNVSDSPPPPPPPPLSDFFRPGAASAEFGFPALPFHKSWIRHWYVVVTGALRDAFWKFCRVKSALSTVVPHTWRYNEDTLVSAA